MQVSFYLLSDTPADLQATQNELSTTPAHFTLACQLCADLFRAKKRVFVYTASQQQAEVFDELLWQFDAERFVPHNLSGEGPKYGAPVEIGWQAPRQNRTVLINLADTIPAFANRFSHIIEFVPTAESLKAQARERFKQYRQLGVNPQTINAN
ncbi:DNA polymerase III subunit chi [Rheinheimera baltica]|uniref:DNA polymerase III subunit chi n=1 Tax=Rheinheimera baltica TaxID=67576 RepID=A0ABT9I1C5_9GAMM|nr:DNA polymerase III subunit chi [Rheinheimera baltica]MDP5136726.1 DNA polymerase III subunit chi [Rheinheimera baltica]